MLVGAKVCDLTEDLLWFVCGVCAGILTSPLTKIYLSTSYIVHQVVASIVVSNECDVYPVKFFSLYYNSDY